ncbi:glycosyltransferase [Algihabitans sp.]|uniref:glycosyltransferase n=1 Tax=Algihabitans sp. TaxID=2821514 RepID=UPI003BAC0D82
MPAQADQSILHISADFPDPLQPNKTKAVSTLLGLTSERFRHHVYSLNRVGLGKGIAAVDFSDGWRAVTYEGLPRGLFLRRYLSRVATWILEDLERRRVSVDLVHAHKLSTDGLVGAQVAEALKVPLVVSSQGNSDLKIIRAKRDLRPVWRKIWQDAALLFPFAPWTADRLSETLGPRQKPTLPLPCPTLQDRVLPPRTTGPLLRTAFHLRDYKNKNAETLIRAVAIAARRTPDLRLEIIGGGDPQAFAALSRTAAREAAGRVRLIGPVAHGRMQETLNDSCAFVMASFRESYGMVYAESLLAGTPVVHSATNGISGYLDSPAVVGVDPRDSAALAEAMARLISDQGDVKAELRRLQETGQLDFLRRDAIAQVYSRAVVSLLQDDVTRMAAK